MSVCGLQAQATSSKQHKREVGLSGPAQALLSLWHHECCGLHGACIERRASGLAGTTALEQAANPAGALATADASGPQADARQH